MLHISTFSGIGGFDLASQWIGWKNIASCELNEFCREVLGFYWPEAYHHDNIKTLTFKLLNEELTKRFGPGWRADKIVLTGGFPCQPYSAAGKRLGTEDERHLWPEMLRAIREIAPDWVVGENVRGLVNWNGGMVFEQVQIDLENAGYEIAPYLLPACAVNAPHQRERIWFIAHRTNARIENLRSINGIIQTDQLEISSNANGSRFQAPGAEQQATRFEQYGKLGGESSSNPGYKRLEGAGNLGICQSKEFTESSGYGAERITTNADGIGLRGKGNGARKAVFIGNDGKGNIWKSFPVESPVCSGNDGIPGELVRITVPKKHGGFRTLTPKQSIGYIRKESLKAYGNAVVPKVPFEIFKAIQQYEDSFI